VSADVQLKRRLSAIDAAFLYLERREIPLAIAGVFVFDGPIAFDDFVTNIESRLPLIPRYRQVVVPSPFNLGYPTWEDYPRFDIHQHIFHESLTAPGGEEQLEALAGELFSQVMDRNQPLWEIHVVDGLSGGRGAMIVRIHHALADGISGAALLKIMFDASPGGAAPVPKPAAAKFPAASAQPSIVEALGSAIHNSLKNMVAAEAALLDFGQALLTEHMQKGLQGLLQLAPEWAKAAERLPFNRPCGGRRKFCWAEIGFDEVKAIRERLGGTVNEVVLTVVTQAVARYTELHGQSVDGRFVKIVCPVNVRGEGEQTSLGNQITFLPVVLPLGIEDAELLRAVSARMEIMKSVRAAELVAILAAWIGAMPPPMQAMFWEGIPLIPLPVPLFNLICTNIPGSTTPLYAVGRRMIASYPQVPTGYELGIGVAVQSYDGKMFFGLTADAEVVPDAPRMRDYIVAAFGDLCRAAGIGKAGRRPARRPPGKRKQTGLAAGARAQA
jgi:WS/DGAT/MGAT family acyltransferase